MLLKVTERRERGRDTDHVAVISLKFFHVCVVQRGIQHFNKNVSIKVIISKGRMDGVVGGLCTKVGENLRPFCKNKENEHFYFLFCEESSYYMQTHNGPFLLFLGCIVTNCTRDRCKHIPDCERIMSAKASQ